MSKDLAQKEDLADTIVWLGGKVTPCAVLDIQGPTGRIRSADGEHVIDMSRVLLVREAGTVAWRRSDSDLRLSDHQVFVLRNIRRAHLESAPRSWIRTIAVLERRDLVERHGWAHGWERTAAGDEALGVVPA